MTNTIDAAGIVAAITRPLVWVDGRAETPFGRLSISILSDRASRGGLEYRAGDYVKAAQDDEEADYRARIAAALDVGPILALVGALTKADAALTEAEAILGGEYGDQYGPLCEMMMALRDDIAALAAFKEASHG